LAGVFYRFRLRFFERVYRLVRYRAWWVLFVSLLLSSVALYSVHDLPIRDSFLDLLPQDDPLIEQFTLRESLLQQSDMLTLMLQQQAPLFSSQQGVAVLQQLAENIRQRLLIHPEIAAVDYRLDPKITALQRLAGDKARLQQLQQAAGALQQGLGGLSPELIGQRDLAEEYAGLNEKILSLVQGGGSGFDAAQAASAISTLKAFNEQLATSLNQIPTQLKQTQQKVDHLLGLLVQLEDEMKQAVLDLSPDGRSLRLVIQPSRPSFVDLRFNKRVVNLVQQTLSGLGLSERNIKAYIAGSYAFTTESNRRLRSDMFKTTLISIVGIALVFLLTFRGVIYPLLVIIPLSMGAVWTAAWAKYTLGGFNLVTSLLPALLLGLGINYGIHFVGRFVDERQQGRSVSKALHEAIIHKGDALLSGAITTALVFFVMLLSQSRGLYEMGWVAGFGVLVSVMLTLLVLPSLIVVTHLVLRRGLRSPGGYRWRLDGFVAVVLRRRLAVIVLIVLLSLGILGPAAGVRIRFVSQELMSTGLPSQKALAAVQKAGFSQAGGSGDFFLFFVKSDNQAQRLNEVLSTSPVVLEVRSAQNYFENQASMFKNLDLEKPFRSSEVLITSLLVNLSNKQLLSSQLASMENTLRFWKDFANLFGAKAVVTETNALAGQLVDIQDSLNRLNVNTLRLSLVRLQDTLKTLKNTATRTLVLPQTVDDFLKALPQELRSDFLTPENEHIVYVQVSNTIYLGDHYERFIRAVDPITTNYLGFPMLQHQLEVAMKHDFWVSTLGALALIVLSLFADFSAYSMLSAPFLVLLPLGLGYGWMLGGMGWLNISFNLTNMVISPLLIGIGVDNGIHLLHRYAESPKHPQRLQRATESVAMPILISNLATMTAFGSLVFASTRGLQVLGISALLGVGSVAFCSLTLLPAVLARRR